jgi:hypothetical protein
MRSDWRWIRGSSGTCRQRGYQRFSCVWDEIADGRKGPFLALPGRLLGHLRRQFGLAMKALRM